MSAKPEKATAALVPAPQYAQLLGEIKQRIRHAQARAWMAVNAEMIRLYWRIGQVIASRQQQEGYGAAVIPRLARDLHNELPEEKSFSERNIKRMLAFYRLYPHAELDAEQAGGLCHRLWHKLRACPALVIGLRCPRLQRTFQPICCWPCPGATTPC